MTKQQRSSSSSSSRKCLTVILALLQLQSTTATITTAHGPCVDSMENTAFYLPQDEASGRTYNCEWLRNVASDEQREDLCNRQDGHPARALCVATCERCTPTTALVEDDSASMAVVATMEAPPAAVENDYNIKNQEENRMQGDDSSRCVDAESVSFWVESLQDNFNCEWLATMADASVKQEICETENHPARHLCLVTCHRCNSKTPEVHTAIDTSIVTPPELEDTAVSINRVLDEGPCFDNTNDYFMVERPSGTLFARNCQWLRQDASPDLRSQLCNESEQHPAYELCLVTCSRCIPSVSAGGVASSDRGLLRGGKRLL